MNIDKLQRTRLNLRTKIKDWYNKGKDTKDLVLKYHEILRELKDYGINIEAKADYLQIDNLDNSSPKSTPKSSLKTSPKSTPKSSLKSTQNFSYILCLAWSEEPKSTKPDQIIKVQKYFDELGLQVLDEEIGKINNRTEHVLKYEFKGSEESFRLLKLCTQFVLDSFAKSEFEKFNVAIFGKKKNY